MPRRGQNIYKRKDGRWEGRYIRYHDEQGKAKYGYVYAKTYNEARQRLTSVQLNSVPKAHILAMGMTYGELLDRWLNVTSYSVKESTLAQYRKLVDSHIRPHLGKYSTHDLSTDVVENHMIFLLSHGRKDGKGGLSPKTVNDILTVIKSTVGYAGSLGYTIPCKPDRISVKNKAPEMRVLTESEQEKLVRVLQDDMDIYKFGVTLSLYTGLRIGELCALKWESVDLENALLTVNETLQRIQADPSEEAKTKVIITPPKSDKSVRVIPLPRFLVEMAESFRTQPESFLLSGSRSFVEPRVMQYKFKKYVAEAGIENVNFHALRHTFATRCIECGFETKSLSEILGHSGVAITLNRYAHSSVKLKRKNMDKLNAVYVFQPSK